MAGLIPNGSFETDTTGWSGSQATITRVNERATDGDWSLRVATNAVINAGAFIPGTNPFAVTTPLTTLRFSVDISGAGTVLVRLNERDVSNSVLVTHNSDGFAVTDGGGTIVHDITLTHADTVQANLSILTTTAQSVTFWIDNVDLDYVTASAPHRSRVFALGSPHNIGPMKVGRR